MPIYKGKLIAKLFFSALVPQMLGEEAGDIFLP
jgi:hypothetical protein